MTDRICVLAVDDEPHILRSLERFCRNQGLRLLKAASAAEALKILEREEVDVILSDHRMPGMTGLDFLRKARRHYPRVPGLLLSGYADLPAVVQALEEKEIFGFLPKPWNREELRALIERAVHSPLHSGEDRP